MPTTLYNGDIELDFDARKHTYTLNGIKVPSVTKITGVLDKPALQHWAVNTTLDHLRDTLQADTPYTAEQIQGILDDAKGARWRQSREALNIGGDAHDWIERYVKAKLLNISGAEMPTYPPTLAAVKSFLAWEQEHEVHWVASERKVYSRLHNYCGTLDALAVLNGVLTVIDFKTSSGIYPEMYLQVVAYAQAVGEEDGITIGDVAIVRIPKDGEMVEVAMSADSGQTMMQLFTTFLHCLGIYQWKEATK